MPKLNRGEVSTAIAANRTELAKEKLECPEAEAGEYKAKEVKKTPKSVIIELEHPSPGRTTTFEFDTTDSGVLVRFGRQLSATTDQPHLVRAPMRERPDYEYIRLMAALIKAREWWCEYLEFILEPSSAIRVRREQSQVRTELAPAPREATPEVRPPSQPPEVTTSRDHTREGKRKKSGGRKPNKTISDRNKEIVALATSGKTPLEIAKHLDARNCSVPHSWTIVEDDGEQYQVRNFEKAYYDPQLHRKLNDLIYDAKKSCAKVVG